MSARRSMQDGKARTVNLLGMRVPQLTRSPVAGARPPDQVHRVLDQPAEHREPVAHAAGAAGKVDDEGRGRGRPAVPRESAARGKRG